MLWLDYTLEERKAMLRRTAHNELLPDYAVEKDWWVTMALKALFRTECGDMMVFKGGTSLSKGWNIIQRFSEDIDLAISHRYFINEITTNNQLKKLRKQCRKFITGDFVEKCDAQLRAIGLKDYRLYPLTQENGKPIDSDADPTVLMLEYTSIADNTSQYVKPSVKIEISCLSMEEPFEVKEICPMISRSFPDADLGTNTQIPTVLPTRTFLEKAFLLCEEFQRPEPRSHRMSRHLYDLSMLMRTPFATQALEDKDLYTRIVEHRRKFYHVGYADYDKDYSPYITICPPDHCMKAWSEDYTALLQSFVYGDKIPFDKLMDDIHQLELMFRKS